MTSSSSSKLTRQDLRKRIQELKDAQLPPLTWDQILTVTAGAMAQADAAILNIYFAAFTGLPEDEQGRKICLCCRNRLVGGLEGALLGGAAGCTTLEWKLIHGEARCVRCGWPYRVLHYNVGGDGEDALIKFMEVGLPYHPNMLVLKEEGSDAPEQSEDHEEMS